MKIVRGIGVSLLALLAGALGFALGALTLGDYTPSMLLEWVAGETPQAHIRAYLRAVEAQDRQAALAAWTLPAPERARFAELERRRAAATDELLARRIRDFTLFEPQWWRTCCEPGLAAARSAGGARIRVQVIDAEGEPWQYTFDVFAAEQPYWGAAGGNPYRHWLLRDVYPAGEPPLYWPLTYSGEVKAH